MLKGFPFLQNTHLLVGVLLCALLLTACAATPQTAGLIEQPPIGVPARVELVDTPFFPQQRYQCGPAALATVLVGHGIDTDPELLKSRVFLPGRRGSLQVEMLATARSYEMLPVKLAPQMEAVILELAARNPVLVLQNLAFTWAPRWHYAVVVGYDLEERVLVLRSGTTRRWVTPFSVFERTWQRGNSWAIVVVSPDRVPATASLQAYLQAVHALETTGHVGAARRGYQAASLRWPGNPVVMMASGNAAYAEADYVAAERAFRAALRRYPQEAAAWNNLGYALSAQGCLNAAISATRCAQTLAPDKPEYTDSLREFRQTLPGVAVCEPLPRCPLP